MQSIDAISHTTHTTTPAISHTTHTTSPISHATTATIDYDFENDDNAFYDFIEFGIASNGGRLSIR